MSGILVTLLSLYMFILFARAVFSWFPIGFDSPFRPVVDFLYRVTEPVLAPVRQVIPPLGGFDLSFLVVLFGIRLILIPLAGRIPF